MTNETPTPGLSEEQGALTPFPTEDVIGTITGRLIGDIGGIYKVLEHMTGGPVWTHQLPRIGQEATPVVVAAHPHLAECVAESERVTPDNWQAWRDQWIDRYGPEIGVPVFTTVEHERIDPLSELAEKVHPDKIVVVTP